MATLPIATPRGAARRGCSSVWEQCGAIVDLATKRCYTKERDSYFAMTVTDWFGGRDPNPTPNPKP